MTIVPSITLPLHWVVTFGPLGLPLAAVALGRSSCSFGCFPAIFPSSIFNILLKNKKKVPITLGRSWALIIVIIILFLILKIIVMSFHFLPLNTLLPFFASLEF